MKLKVFLLVVALLVISGYLFTVLESVIDCGCGGCGGYQPVKKFSFNPDKLYENIDRAKNSEMCQYAGCSKCFQYYYFDFFNRKTQKDSTTTNREENFRNDKNFKISCGSDDSIDITEVIQEAKKYNGQSIGMKAVYYESTEKTVLTSRVTPGPDGAYRFVSPEQVWASWAVDQPEDFYSRLNELKGIGGPDYYGEVRITGVFQVGSQAGYGHMGKYPYSFLITSVLNCE